VHDFKAKIASMSVVGTQEPHADLSNPLYDVLADDEFCQGYIIPVELAPVTQDFAPSPSQKDYDSWPWMIHNDNGSDVSTPTSLTEAVTPLSLDHSLENLYNFDPEIECQSFEASVDPSLKSTESREDSDVWSILLSGGWPRLD
jgi:hypothetical protein